RPRAFRGRLPRPTDLPGALEGVGRSATGRTGRGGGMTRGTAGSLHAFVEGRRTALFRSAYLLCGNRDEPDDLVQTTLVKVVLGARRHERLDNLEAYARRTLVNT